MSTPETVPATLSASGRSVATSAFVSILGIGVQGVARLIYTVLIGRTFGTEALGHASTLLSLSIFAALFWPTPAGNTASRFLAVALRAGLSDALLRRTLALTMLCSSLVLGAVTVPVALALGNSPTTALSAAWLVMGYGVYTYARGAQLGYHRVGKAAAWDGVTAFLSLGLLVVVCVTGGGLFVLVPLSLGYTVFALACWPRGSEHTDAPEAGQARVALSFGLWNVLTGITTNGLLQLTMVAAQLASPGTGAGVFAAAFTLATPASMLGQAVAQIVIPAFAHHEPGAPLRRRGPLMLFVGFSFACALVFGLVAAAAPWFLPLFYPAEGQDAVGPLRFLMLGVFVFTVALIPAALLLAGGRSREVALSSVVGFVVGVGAMFAAAATWGVQAGSVGFLVGSSVNLVAVLALSFFPTKTDHTGPPAVSDEGPTPGV